MSSRPVKLKKPPKRHIKEGPQSLPHLRLGAPPRPKGNADRSTLIEITPGMTVEEYTVKQNELIESRKRPLLENEKSGRKPAKRRFGESRGSAKRKLARERESIVETALDENVTRRNKLLTPPTSSVDNQFRQNLPRRKAPKVVIVIEDSSSDDEDSSSESEDGQSRGSMSGDESEGMVVIDLTGKNIARDPFPKSSSFVTLGNRIVRGNSTKPVHHQRLFPMDPSNSKIGVQSRPKGHLPPQRNTATMSGGNLRVLLGRDSISDGEDSSDQFWSRDRLRHCRREGYYEPSIRDSSVGTSLMSSIEEDDNQTPVSRIEDGEVYDVSEVIGEYHAPDKHEFLVRWVEFPRTNWVKADGCCCPDLIREYRARRDHFLRESSADSDSSSVLEVKEPRVIRIRQMSDRSSVQTARFSRAVSVNADIREAGTNFRQANGGALSRASGEFYSDPNHRATGGMEKGASFHRSSTSTLIEPVIAGIQGIVRNQASEPTPTPRPSGPQGILPVRHANSTPLQSSASTIQNSPDITYATSDKRVVVGKVGELFFDPPLRDEDASRLDRGEKQTSSNRQDHFHLYEQQKYFHEPATKNPSRGPNLLPKKQQERAKGGRANSNKRQFRKSNITSQIGGNMSKESPSASETQNSTSSPKPIPHKSKKAPRAESTSSKQQNESLCLPAVGNQLRTEDVQLRLNRNSMRRDFEVSRDVKNELRYRHGIRWQLRGGG